MNLTDDGSDGSICGMSLHEREAVTSTQDEAGRLWDAGERAPFAVLAREQTAGRGRLGRCFITPPGGGLALTVALRTDLSLGARTWIPLATGLTVVDALSGPPFGLTAVRARQSGAVDGGRAGQVGLKWPNDIHTADGRKLGGILVEGRGSDGVLVGIGLNLRGPVVDAEGNGVGGAAWLSGPESVLGQDIDDTAQLEHLRRSMARDLAAAVQREVRTLESCDGNAQESGTHARYAVTCLTLGCAVRVDPMGRTPAAGDHSGLSGRAVAVDDRGRLVLRTADGTDIPVDAGDVLHGPRDDEKCAEERCGGDRGAEAEDLTR